MLVQHAMRLDLEPEEMKAWPQSLGHADVLTTFTSYGPVTSHRQGELIRTQRNTTSGSDSNGLIAVLEAVLAGLKGKVA